VRSSQANAAPLLQKVLMSYGDGRYVVLEDNLQKGLEALAALGKANAPPNTGTPSPGGTPEPGTTPSAGATTTPPANQPPGQITPELSQAAAAVDKAIADLKAAQQAGDFVKQGEALKALDDAITRFQAAQQASANTPASGSASPSPTPSG
jgi:uncharacterized membrane protein (UPF0182 family)